METIQKTKHKKTTETGIREFFSKLSKALMLPIALLPIAGLFLGLGAGMINILNASGLDKLSNPGAYIFPETISALGAVIFGNLPILFCVAIAIAYTEDAGVAGFSAVIGWIVFNSFQSLFINPLDNGSGVIVSYNILFYSGVPTSVVTQNIGITSLQTSVFGGMAVGFFVAYLYNRFHTFQMPSILGFFSGTRLVPILVFLFIPGLAAIFLLAWPLAGIWLEKLGFFLSSMPYKTNALLFGIIERALIPFGLHHAFYTPLWFTSVGGTAIFTADHSQISLASSNLNYYYGSEGMWFGFQNEGIPYSAISTTPVTVPGYTDYNYIVYNGTEIGIITAGAQPGEYLQGKYPIMIFGLPAAGFAIINSAKKENRQVVTSIIGAAIATSFLTGVTEPLEFTFLFVAPFLYYGFHIWMAGLSFWFCSLLGANVGMTFSGGIIDYVLYGILPAATGFDVTAWAIPVVGIIFAPIYYFVFYFYIVRFDIQTPGRSDEIIKLTTKHEYQKIKQQNKEKNNQNEIDKTIDSSPTPIENFSGLKNPTKLKPDRLNRVNDLLTNLGGMENLNTIDACVTRLRLTINDVALINANNLKAMGSSGIVFAGAKSIQVVFGAEADLFKSELLAIRRYHQRLIDHE